MMNKASGGDDSNFSTFRDCFSSVVLQRISSTKLKPARKSSKRRARKSLGNPHPSPFIAHGSNETEPDQNDAEDLADFLAVGENTTARHYTDNRLHST